MGKSDSKRVDRGAPLHIKWRPTTFEEVIGQEPVIASLKSVLATNVPHAFLFTGPSGVGKTTLARILARMMNCSEAGILEIDAATHSGVEDMRRVTDMVRYKALGENPTRFIIVDEVHAISKATFQSLLLALEEPPEHVYWCLATTEPGRIPDTIKSRCHAYDLKPVAWETLSEYLSIVAKAESIDTSEEILDMLARKAQGSVRQALVYLSMSAGLQDKDEVAAVIEEAVEAREAVDLARFLLNPSGGWNEALKRIQALGPMNPESVRITVVNYVAAALGQTKSDNEALRLLNILQAFSSPFNSSERLAPLYLAVGGVILGG